MDADQLQAVLEQSSTTDLLILDVRSRAEFVCSHLPRAVAIELRSPQADQDIQEVAGSRKRPVLVYCSVGVRSAKMVMVLQNLGFEQVIHLDGGVFEWINRGHSLVCEGQATHKVHPFNRLWGFLLKTPHA
jgi:rhodanese-related sulfurtransferase